MKETYQSNNDFLLSAVQHGDLKAFDTLFRRYYPMLCAYGHRFVELEDAEEIVEDSLLWIWRRIGLFAAAVTHKVNVYVLARNRIVKTVYYVKAVIDSVAVKNH